MDNFLTKDKVKSIVDNSPKGTNPEDIINGLVKRGYTLQGFNDTPQAPTQVQPKTEPTGIIDTIKNSFKESSIFGQGGKSLEEINKEAANVALGFAGGESGAIKEKVVSGVKETLPKIIEKGKDIISGKSKDLQKIEQMITKSPTPTEAKLATMEGRLIKGKEPTLLRGGTLDVVLPSEKVIKSKETIFREIPNAGKLSEPDLYTALEARTTDMANKLSPELKKVKITKNTTDTLNNSWNVLKNSQKENIYISDSVNLPKYQKNFETNYLNKIKKGNYDDVWNVRKAYDISVPTNVKNATSISSDKLQTQKELWLQNREILNNALTDAETGLGDTIKNSFSDMNSMYNAKENIISKAKIDLKPQSSKVKQWMKEHPYASTFIGASTLTGAGKAMGL